MSLSFQNFGEHAILISWHSEISDSIVRDIHAFNNKIQNLVPELLTETVPAYCSLTLYLQTGINKEKLLTVLRVLYQEKTKLKSRQARVWEVPVCYHESLGIDIKTLAAKKELSVDKVIQLHSEVLYNVDFLGFLPGFPYLSGLNPSLYTDRLSQPRLKVAKGSVAIGGKQTGIYPVESPGGWHIIGRTPMAFFNPKDDKPCFIRPLEKIKFIAISLKEFNRD
jgi:inhibitor of KinA